MTIEFILIIIIAVIAALILIQIFTKYHMLTVGGSDDTIVDVMATPSPDDYPYKKLSMKPDDIKARFERLKHYAHTIVTQRYNIKSVPASRQMYQRRQLVISVNDSNYDAYDNISDYFTETTRVRCKRNDQQLSSHEYWQNNKQKVTDHAIKMFGSATPFNLREALYDLHYECTTFRPSLIVGFIKMFNSQSVLDISVGWGDRLIGCIAYGQNNNQEIQYVGTDPADMHDDYKKIIEFFAGTTDKYITIKSPFETAVLPKRNYDLVFSSPPFFDLELYIGDNQSYHNRTLQQWFDDFLMVSLKKAYDALIPSGHMVLYISDVYNREPFIAKMLDLVDKFPGAKYLGCLPQIDLSKKHPVPRPFWIYQKTR